MNSTLLVEVQLPVNLSSTVTLRNLFHDWGARVWLDVEEAAIVGKRHETQTEFKTNSKRHRLHGGGGRQVVCPRVPHVPAAAGLMRGYSSTSTSTRRSVPKTEGIAA